MSEKEDSPGAESFHSLDAEGESSSLYGDAEFFSDTYGDAETIERRRSQDDAVVPDNESVERTTTEDEIDHAPTDVVDEMAALRARLEAMSSYASHEEEAASNENQSDRLRRAESSDNPNAGAARGDNERYSSGGYLDSYANSQPRKPPPDRKRQRELSKTRAQEQKRRESGFSGSDMSVDTPQVDIDPGDVPFDMQLPNFSHGYTEPDVPATRSGVSIDDPYPMDFRSRTPELYDNQSDMSRSPIPSEFERAASGHFEYNVDDYQSDQFERVSRETDDIIRQIAATLGDARSTVEHFDAMQEEDIDYPDFRDDEDPIFQNRFGLEETEMEFSPSPRASFAQLSATTARRMSFEQSGMETRFTAAELEDERTPSPEAEASRYRAKFANVRRDSTMEKLESLLGSHAPEKTFFDTETMEEISTYGRIRKIKKQSSEDQRILDEFERHFDLCFDESGDEDEFVSINDAEDVADRAAGRIPEEFYTEMLQRERPFSSPEAEIRNDFRTTETPAASDLDTPHTVPGERTLAPNEDLFDLRRSREVLDLVEAAKNNMPIHMERRRSFYDELSDHIEPRRSLDGQCKTRALTPTGEEVTLEVPKVRLQTQKSDASTADSELLFVPVGAEKEKSQSPSRDEGVRASRGFFEELDVSELEEKAKQQRSIPFEDTHIRAGTTLEDLADRPKTPIKSWRAEVNLKTGEKMYESERYGGKDRNPDYGEAFGRFPVRKFAAEEHPTYEAFERKSRRDHPIRGKARDVQAYEERASQKQKFVNAPASTITSAFSATVVDSDSYGEAPLNPEAKMATFPRKSEKRRRKTSLQGTRADKTPSRETSKDRFLREVDGQRISSPETNQKRLQDWRANFHQFPLSSESTEAPPAGLDGSPLRKVPSYEVIESPGASQSQDIPARKGSLRGKRRPGSNLLDPHGNYRSGITRTQSVESAEEWSQSGYFVKPPPRRARSRQSIVSTQSAATDSLNIETIPSEHSDPKQVGVHVLGKAADVTILQNNRLSAGPPQPPKRTRSINRSLNRLDQIDVEQKSTPQQVNYLSSEPPKAPRRRSRSASTQRIPQGDYEKFYPTVESKLSKEPKVVGDVTGQGGQADTHVIGTEVTDAGTLTEREKGRSASAADSIKRIDPGSPKEAIRNSSGPAGPGGLEVKVAEHKDYEKVVVKLKRGSIGSERQTNVAETVKATDADGEKSTATEAGTVGSVNVCGDDMSALCSSAARSDAKAPYSDEEIVYSDEEISSIFTVTFKPGLKVAEIEETPVQSSKSSSRRSSNSGADDRHRLKTRFNQQLLQKTLQGMDVEEDRNLTEDFDETNADVDFAETLENLPQDPELIVKKAANDEGLPRTQSVVDSSKYSAKQTNDKQTTKQETRIETAEPDIKSGVVDALSLGEMKTEAKPKPAQVVENIYKTRTDSPYSVKRDKTYYSDTAETMSTASHVTAIEKPKIEVIRSSSVESGYEVVDTSGSGSKPRAPQRRRRSSATGSAVGSASDLKIMSQDKFGLVKPTYGDVNEWARRALSSDDEASSYHEDPHLDRHFDETLDAIDKILTRTPREELEQPAEPTRPSVSKYEELSNLRDVLRQKLEQRNLARSASQEAKQAADIGQLTDGSMATTGDQHSEQIDQKETPAITGIYLDGVLSGLSSGDPLLSQPVKDYDVMDQKAEQGNLIGGIIRGIRKSIDLGSHSEPAFKKQDSSESQSRGFFGDLIQKIQDKFEDISGDFRETETKKRNSLAMPSRQLSSDKDNGTHESGRPKSAMSGISSELGVPDRGRSPLPTFLAQPRMGTEYTTDSEMSMDYETRYKRPVPRRRRTRDRIFDSSSDIPNSSTNEDFDPFFRLDSQRRRSQPSFFTLDAPKPPKRTKSTSNLSSSSLSVPPLPPKRVKSDHLMIPQAPRRTKSKERLAQEMPPPLPMKSAHGKVPMLPPVESATATLVSADRWQKGRLVQMKPSSVGVSLQHGTAEQTAKIPSSEPILTSSLDPSVRELAIEPTVTHAGSRGSSLVKNDTLSSQKSGSTALKGSTNAVADRAKSLVDTLAPLDSKQLDMDSLRSSTTDQGSKFQDAVSDLPWVPKTMPPSVPGSVSPALGSPQTHMNEADKHLEEGANRPMPRRRRRRDADEDGDVFYNASDVELQDGIPFVTPLGKQEASAAKPIPSTGSNSYYEIDVPPRVLTGTNAQTGQPRQLATENQICRARQGTSDSTEIEKAKSARTNMVPGSVNNGDSRGPGQMNTTVTKPILESELPSSHRDDLSDIRNAQGKRMGLPADVVANEDFGLTGVYVPGMELHSGGRNERGVVQGKKNGRNQVASTMYGQEQYGSLGGGRPANEDMSITGVFLPGSGFEGFLQENELAAMEGVRAPRAEHGNRGPEGLKKHEASIRPSSYPAGMGPQGAYIDPRTGKVVHTIASPPGLLEHGAIMHGAPPLKSGALDKNQLPFAEETIVPMTNIAGMGPQGMYLDKETGKMVYTGSGPLVEKFVIDHQQLGGPGSPQKANQGILNNDILGLENIQDRFDALMANEATATEQSAIHPGQQAIYSKANKGIKEQIPLPPAKLGKAEHRMSNAGQGGLLNAPKISVSCGDVSDSGGERGLLSRLIPIRTKKKKKPQFMKIDPEQLARLPTMRPATPEPVSPANKNFLTVDDPNAPPPGPDEQGQNGETFTRRLIRRGSNALMGLTGSFRRHRSPSYIEGAVPVDSPYQATVVDTTDGTASDVKDPNAQPLLGSSPSILRHPERASRGRSAEPAAVALEKSAKVQFISSPVHGRTLKSETKPVNAEADPLYFEEPAGPITIDVTPSRQDIQFPVHGRKLKLATEGIAQPIRPTEESYLYSQYTDGEEGVRGKMPDIDPRTQVTGLGRGDEKRGSIDDEFERDIFIPKQPKPPISLTKMLKGALTGKGLPWSSQLGGREWARKRQNRMELHSGTNSLLGAMQVGAAGVESRSIFGEEARQRKAEEDALKPQKEGKTVSLADLMDIRQSFRNEELARMVAGAPPDVVLAHVKASPYVDSMTMETVKKLLVPDFAKIRERLEERFRKKIPKESTEKHYQPFRFDRGIAVPQEEVTYMRAGPLRMDSVRNRLEAPDLTDPAVQALYGGPTYASTPSNYPDGLEETECKPLTLTLPDSLSAVKRFDILAPAAPEPGRNAHEVIREAAELAAQPPPTPQIPPLTLPIEAMAPPPPMSSVTVADKLATEGQLAPTTKARVTVEVPEPDIDLCNRRSSLILVNAKDLDLARPQRLNELTSVNVDVKRLRQKLPAYKNFMAAEV